MFLAAGGEDERAPIAAQQEDGEGAAQRPACRWKRCTTTTEGHGFYIEEHRREYYTRLLAFLAQAPWRCKLATTSAAVRGRAK